jgi:hypothetical protein
MSTDDTGKVDVDDMMRLIGHEPGRREASASGGARLSCAVAGCELVIATTRAGQIDYSHSLGFSSHYAFYALSRKIYPSAKPLYPLRPCPWHDPKERHGVSGAND